MDVHTEYKNNYIESCYKVLNQIGATCVGGAWVAGVDTYFKKSLAAALQNSIVTSGGLSRNSDYEGKADTVYLGCCSREALDRNGLFNEELIRNQDDELCLRIIANGGTVWQSKKTRSCYYPRKNIVTLFSQYFQYGFWKVRVFGSSSFPVESRGA